jgi:anti-sigma factor RsiW
MTRRLIPEEDVQGLVDGRLDPGREADVRASLDFNPETAARIRRYTKQGIALRGALATIADEPIPPELDLAQIISHRRRSRRLPWWGTAAAAIVLLCLGSGTGWLLRGMAGSSRGEVSAIAAEGSENYAVFGSDQMHPVEIHAGDREELVKWASARLQRSVAIPDLSASGYRFMGGRIVTTTHGPAVLFMYDDNDGVRLVMLVRPMTKHMNKPMTSIVNGPVSNLAWADKGMGYSLVGSATPQTLRPIADKVREQLSGAG